MRKKPGKPKKRLAKKFAKRNRKGRCFARLEVDFLFDYDFNDGETDANRLKFSSLTAINISSGGLSFVTHERLPRGTLLKFKLWKKSWHRYKNGFIKPDWVSAGEPKFVVGKVLRSMEVSGGFETAVNFVNCHFRWLYYHPGIRRLTSL